MSLLDFLNSHTHTHDVNNEIEVRFKLRDPIQSSIIQQYMTGKGKETRHVTWEFLNDTGSRIIRTGVSSLSMSDILAVLPSLQTGIYTHENKTLIKSDVLTLGGVYMKVSNSIEKVLGEISYMEYNKNPVTLFRHKNRLTYTHPACIKVDITKIYSVILGTNKVDTSTEVEIEMLPGYADCIPLIVSFIYDIVNLAMIPSVILNKSNASRITGRLNYTNERVSGMIINSIITKPVSFMRSHLQQLYSNLYAVSYKADGVRCILVVMPFCDTKVCIMLTADTFQVLSRQPGYCDVDIYDAELCGNDVYIFDVIQDSTYDTRVQCIQNFVNTWTVSVTGIRIIAKPVALPTHDSRPVVGLYNGNQLLSLPVLANDGVIFTPITGGYYTEVLKWKPTDQNTIDLKVTFYRHRPAQREIHIGLSGPRPVEPAEIAFNNKHRSIVITQLPIEELILNMHIAVGNIVECAYNEDNTVFIPIKKRTDKVIPNGWGVIFDAMTLIKDNVAFDELTRETLTSPKTAAVATIEYNPNVYDTISNYNDAGRNYETVMNNRIRMFHNYVKKALFDAYTAHRKDLSVADICCGQGSALKWVITSNVKKLLLVDSSEKMLETALQRSAQFNIDNKTEIINEQLDMRVASITGTCKYDIVQCHFAIQYFFENTSSLDNIISSVSSLMHADSYFIGIMPDGDILNSKLLSGGGVFEAHTDQTDYTIKAHYGNYNSRDPVTAFNRKITVCLKESILDTYSETGTDTGVCEYLASFKMLVESCKRYNMTLVETAILRHPYKLYLDHLRYKDPRVLSDVDHAFSYTYRYFVFTKGNSTDTLNFDKSTMPAPFRNIHQRLSVTKTLDHNCLTALLTNVFHKRDPTVTQECILSILHEYTAGQQRGATNENVILALATYFNCAICVLYQKRSTTLHKKTYNEHKGVTGVIVLIECARGEHLIVKCENNMIWDPIDYPYKLPIK